MSRESQRVAQAIRKLYRSEARLLGAMMRRGWMEQHEMVRWGGLRFGARIFTLRKRGHKIVTKRTGMTSFEYRLVKARTA